MDPESLSSDCPELPGVAALLVRGKRETRAYFTGEFSGEIRAGILERVRNRRASQRKSRSRDHRKQARFHSCAAALADSRLDIAAQQEPEDAAPSQVFIGVPAYSPRGLPCVRRSRIKGAMSPGNLHDADTVEDWNQRRRRAALRYFHAAGLPPHRSLLQ